MDLDLLAASGFDMLQIAGRAVVMYGAGLVIVRFAKRRLLGHATAFDVVLAFILGSLFSRAINGAAAVITTIVAAVVLVALHWLICKLAYRSKKLDALLKGRHRHLVLDGEVQDRAMARSEISDLDLYEALRLHGIDKPQHARKACLERNGEISVIPRREARVVDVRVAEGVQTVRIELG